MLQCCVVGRTNCVEHNLLPKGEWPRWLANQFPFFSYKCITTASLHKVFYTMSGAGHAAGVVWTTALAALGQGSTGMSWVFTSWSKHTSNLQVDEYAALTLKCTPTFSCSEQELIGTKVYLSLLAASFQVASCVLWMATSYFYKLPFFCESLKRVQQSFRSNVNCNINSFQPCTRQQINNVSRIVLTLDWKSKWHEWHNN